MWFSVPLLVIGMLIAAPFLGWRIIVEHQNVNQATGQHVPAHTFGDTCWNDAAHSNGSWDHPTWDSPVWVCYVNGN